ncbi:hypothetical protein BH10BAC1_BH10BAC1_21300 [soil metagenome]
MKNTAKLVLKGLLVIVLLTGSSIALSTAGINSGTEAKAAMSYQVVYQYLVNRGYQVVTLEPIAGTKGPNWTSHTILNGVHYMTTVYVQGNEIIGQTDAPL